MNGRKKMQRREKGEKKKNIEGMKDQMKEWFKETITN